MNDFVKHFQNMNKYKSADIDGNVIYFFIHAKEFITPYLVTMFNYFFEKGIYPESWCNGIIVPIFKKGDRTCAKKL